MKKGPIFALCLLLGLRVCCQDRQDIVFAPLDPTFATGIDVVTWNAKSEANYGKLTAENPLNADYWLNFYKAVRFKTDGILTLPSQPRLDTIDARMQRFVPGTWQQLLVHYWNGNHDRSRLSDLEKANSLHPNDPEILRQLIGGKIISGDLASASGYTEQWEKTGAMPMTLSSYAFNVLQSPSQDAILLTRGESDTYPLIRQQVSSGVRKDIGVLSILLCGRPENRAAQFRRIGLTLPDNDSVSAFDAAYIRRIALANPAKKIYIASTNGSEILTALQQDLYITGLAFRYSPGQAVDNLPLLRDNVGRKMQLGYLVPPIRDPNAADAQYANQLNMNYVLPLVLAAKQYDLMGLTSKAEDLRKKARFIGAQAGRGNEVENLIAGK